MHKKLYDFVLPTLSILSPSLASFYSSPTPCNFLIYDEKKRCYVFIVFLVGKLKRNERMLWDSINNNNKNAKSEEEE